MGVILNKNNKIILYIRNKVNMEIKLLKMLNMSLYLELIHTEHEVQDNGDVFVIRKICNYRTRYSLHL